jgi:hypothetical protein
VERIKWFSSMFTSPSNHWRPFRIFNTVAYVTLLRKNSILACINSVFIHNKSTS